MHWGRPAGGTESYASVAAGWEISLSIDEILGQLAREPVAA